MTNKHDFKKELRYCPYCETEITEAALLHCKVCEIEIFFCPKCHKAIPRDKKICPHCGADIKGEAAKGD
ncbi:zinc ribbon domain-containing protein [Chloroflexota bacterium]